MRGVRSTTATSIRQSARLTSYIRLKTFPNGNPKMRGRAGLCTLRNDGDALSTLHCIATARAMMLSVRYAGLTAANDAKSSRNAINRNAKITTTGIPCLVLSRQSDDQARSMAPLVGEAFPNIPRPFALDSPPPSHHHFNQCCSTYDRILEYSGRRAGHRLTFRKTSLSNAEDGRGK